VRFAATEDGDDDEHPRELVARDAPVPINIFFPLSLGSSSSSSSSFPPPVSLLALTSN
jgi:hypothetical protein